MAIEFGVPTRQINKKEELFPETPVITMKKWEGKGHNCMFSFNPKALETLGITPGINSINFAFDGEEAAYIGKNSDEGSLLVAKNMNVSNKKTYEYICKIYGLENSKDNHLEITDSVDLGAITVYKLQVITPIVEEVTKVPNPVEDEIAHVVEAEVIDTEAKEAAFEDMAATEPHGY